MHLKQIIFPALLIFSCTKAQESYSFGKPVHTKIVTEKKLEGDLLTVSFKVDILDTKTNAFSFEGTPWQFKIKAVEGAKFSQDKFTEKELNRDLPGYTLVSQKGVEKTGKMDYSFVAFVCTKDKTRCYREAHNASIEW